MEKEGGGPSDDITDNLLHSQQGQIQAEAKYQERIQVGSSSVFNRENEDLQMIQYVFECLSPEDKVFISPLSYLTQEEFATLKPETFVDSLVIDIFVEILTHVERKNKTMPSNWYLPVKFSNAALKGSVGHFLNFVHGQKMRENYMSNLESCEEVFVPVHVGVKSNGGHFYLYVIHLKNEEIEIWDSLPNTFVAEIERDEITKKFLLAMEKLFVEVPFTKFQLKMANDIQQQHNGYDCGIFVMKFMEQSDNYVERNSSFSFDSGKEREKLAMKLLNSDLNQEKQNLYDKARRHYAQVEKQDGNRRLRVDRVDGHDLLEKGVDGHDLLEKVKRVSFEGMNLGDKEVLLPGDINQLVMKDCHQGTGARSLCSVLSYGHNNNPHQFELLKISNCEDVEYLCCCSCPFCTSSQLVGLLELVALINLKHLVSPYADPLHQSTLFSHLTDLRIWRCNSMETLMTPKLLAHLQNLRTIHVESCGKMKEMVGEDHSEMELTGSGYLMAVDDLFHPIVTLPSLTSLELVGMPQLNFVYRGIMLCPSLQTFSAEYCELLNPHRIAITYGFELPMEKTSIGYRWQINID